MKKIISCFLAIICAFSVIFPIGVFAATVDEVKEDTENIKENVNTIKDTATDVQNTLYDTWNYLHNELEPAIKNSGSANNATKSDVTEVKDSIADESEKGVESYFSKQKTTDDKATAENSINNFAEGVQQASNHLWSTLVGAFKTGEIFGYNIDAENYSKGSLFNTFKIFGYSLVLVFFATTLIESTIKYEIFTLRGGVNIFGRLILSKLIIDMSGKVCMAIVDETTSLTNKVLGSSIETIQLNTPQINIETSDIWAVGPIIDFILGVVLGVPIIINLFVILIVGSLVIAKLILRSFEMCMLVVVSPAFFACFSSEVTKPYFKNFILTFIQVTAQIIFMAVVYYIGIDKVTSDAVNINGVGDLVMWFQKTIPNTLIIIAMCVMMIKPPRVLTNLIR